jgi:hypothetical protein
VALVLEVLVTVTVPSAVVVPEEMRLTVNTALLVVFVLSYTTVPARLAGTVSAMAIGTLIMAPAAGLPLNGKAIGTCATSVGSCEYVAVPVTLVNDTGGAVSATLEAVVIRPFASTVNVATCVASP